MNKGATSSKPGRSDAAKRAEGRYNEGRRGTPRLPGVYLDADEAALAERFFAAHGGPKKLAILDAMRLFLKKNEQSS